MRKIYLLVGLFTLLFAFSCEKDDESLTEKSEEIVSKQEPIVETISYKKFKENFDEPNKLDLFKSVEGTLLKSPIGNFTIKTDEIKQITLGKYTSYTMVLKEKIPQSSVFYNLTIEDKAGVQGMFITEYRPTQDWILNQTGPFDGGITTYHGIDLKVDPGDDGSDGGGSGGGGGGPDDGTAYPYDCEGEVRTTQIRVPYPCGCGHWTQAECDGCNRNSPQYPGYEWRPSYECYEGPTGGDSQDPDPDPSGGNSTDDPDTELHSITILMPDGSTMETPEILSDMLSLNPNETQELTEDLAFSDKVYLFIANNQFSEEAKAFANEAIDAFVNGGEVDFVLQIINELTEKAECIYNKLNQSSTSFADAIQKFDGEFPVSHLKFTINNSLPSGNYGITNPPNNYLITIEMSNTQLENISDLGGAVAFVHEVIHAEIYRKMLSAAQNGNLEPENMTRQQQIDYVNSLRNNFPGIYDYYIDRYKPTWNHNMMAEHYIGVIADAIGEFDNSRLSRQVYEDIAWAGLRKLEDGSTSVAWDNLSSAEKQRILNNLSQYFFNGASNC